MKINFKVALQAATALIFISSACTPKIEQKTTENSPAQPIIGEIVNPQQDQRTYHLDLPGELKPYEQVGVFAKAQGFVKNIYVDRGSVVKKGQLLALLEAPEMNQQLLSLQSNERKLYENYLLSKQVFDRLKKASAQAGAVAAVEIEHALGQLRSDSLAYHAAKANTGASTQMKDYLRLLAPFDGMVIEKNVSTGALVGPSNSSPVFLIAQQNQLRLTVAIPEKHSHSFNKNTQAGFWVSNRPGKMYEAKLSRSSGILNPNDRSVMLEFDVDNTANDLHGGEYAQVKIALKRPDSTFWVPTSSVVEAQSGAFIVQVKNSKIKRMPVALGLQIDGQQEVFGNISVRDSILKKGSEELEEGTQIQHQ